MTNLYRMRTRLEGFEGAPGVATMYSLDFATFPGNLRTFWQQMLLDMPPTATATVETIGDEIEDTTGALVGAWTTGTPEVSDTGGGGADYMAPAGGLVTWETDTILDGHRVKGRTFVVPMSSDGFEFSGMMRPTHHTVMYDAAQVFVASESTSFVIWHRPRAARPGPVPPARAARPGGHALVTGSSVSFKVAVLRSRRD